MSKCLGATEELMADCDDVLGDCCQYPPNPQLSIHERMRGRPNEFLGSRPIIPNAPGPRMSIPHTKDRNETERLALRTQRRESDFTEAEPNLRGLRERCFLVQQPYLEQLHGCSRCCASTIPVLSRQPFSSRDSSTCVSGSRGARTELGRPILSLQCACTLYKQC